MGRRFRRNYPHWDPRISLDTVVNKLSIASGPCTALSATSWTHQKVCSLLNAMFFYAIVSTIVMTVLQKFTYHLFQTIFFNCVKT